MGKMPVECNGIALIDCKKDFCKLNCEWRSTHAGRHKNENEIREKQAVRSKFKNPIPLCIVLEKDLLEFIKAQAIQMSVIDHKFISHNELIRNALIKSFPTPKQYDMFGKSL